MDNMNPIGNGLNFPHFRPLNFRDYRNYLPTAYDDSLSMQESLLQVLNFCNEIGLLNQNMSDNWNTLLGWIKTNGIDDAVSGQLNAWVADGTMSKVLNKTALQDINKKLDDLLHDYPVQLQSTKDFVTQTANAFKNDVNNTLNGQSIKIQQNYDSLMQQLSSISTGVKGVYNNLAALTSAKPNGDTGVYVTTDTGHWFFWNGSIWQDGGQFQAAQVGQDQIDLIKQQTLDFDNGIINGAAINSALGNKPYSAVGNVRLELDVGNGARAFNNDVTPTKKGVSINLTSTFKTYYFDQTLKMIVRNDDHGSPHTFLVDYVAVKTDGTRLALCSPLTKFSLPAESETNVITTLPAFSRLSKVAQTDLDHLEIMVYSQSDASCQLLIKTPKLYNEKLLPDIDNEDNIDNDNLLAPNQASSSNLNSEKVFVEGLNKTCQRFYTNTGTNIWSTFAIPLRANMSLTQHIQDEKLNRPLKGTITVKIANDKSAINKYYPSLAVYDASSVQHIFDVSAKNATLTGNILKYDFTVPSINTIVPNISFSDLNLIFSAYNVVNFDVTLIDASLKFEEATTTITPRENDDLGVNIMKALNNGDNSIVSTSGAITCTITDTQERKVFKVTKDMSSNTGTLSIMLRNFSINDVWTDKKIDLFTEKNTDGVLNVPMQLTFHMNDGTTIPVALNPLYIQSQAHYSQIIPALYTKITNPQYVTLDLTFTDTTAWSFFLKDISFKTCMDYGTQAMNYLPDRSAKLPQLRLFGDLSLITSRDDKIIVPCSFVNHEQVINAYAQLNWQGKSTQFWPKKSYTVAFFSDPNATVKLNFKPMPNFYLSNKFTAKADYIDRFHVRNGYGAWLFAQMIQTRKSLPSFFKSMNNFGEIQIMPINIVNNGNLGIYTLQTKKSNALYGMDKSKPNDMAIQGIENTDGALWKKDTVTFDPAGDTGDFELISDSDKQQNVQSAINRLATFINSSTDDAFTANLSQYIDLDSLADLIISMQLTQNYDNGDGKNITYVTHDGLKWYVQSYDMDATLGTSWQPASSQDDDVDVIKTAGNKLITRFTALFKDYIKNRFNDVDNSGVIAPFRMQEKFKEMTDSIGEYNFEQDNVVWPNESYNVKDLSYILWLIVHRYYFTKQWISTL